ncbi:MAG: 50S ribosome-binding GTPase [Gemmatimonadota bacterium]
MSRELGDRLEALERLVVLGRGRLPSRALAAAEEVVGRTRGRLTHGTAWTVAALAGSTGSGKSSLFNALAGAELSRASVQRPTTGTAHACVWGDESAQGLLEWLGVRQIHRVGGADPALDGLVLLDLPDHDSVRLENRLEMSRLIELVDLMIWVLDPEKYADAALHEGFLRPLRDHADVMLIALNQVDRLSDAELAACERDLAALLAEGGLQGVPVVATSTLDGTGIAELRARLVELVGERRAAVRRIEADLNSVTTRVAEAAGLEGEAPELGRGPRKRLVEGLAEAAGVPALGEAIAAGYRRDAVARTGWPVTRWAARFRSHPLSRLGLGPGGAARATSLPRPGPSQLSVLRQRLREVADRVSQGLPAPWPGRVRSLVMDDAERLLDPLDQAISAVRTETAEPAWWAGVGLLQTLLLLTTAGGLVWLGVLFVFGYLQLPPPPTPEWRGFPLPTLMALGGAAGGILLSLVARGLARVGGRHRAARAERALRERIDQVARDEILAPLERELDVRRQLADDRS